MCYYKYHACEQAEISLSSSFSLPIYCSCLCCIAKLLAFAARHLAMCSSSESQVISNSDIGNCRDKNYCIDGEIAGGRSSIGELLKWLWTIKVAEELTSLWKIAYPTAITGFLLHSKSIIAMLFLGRLGDIQLAGGSLAIGFANITGYSVIKGLAMAMESICSQAYGAKRFPVLSQTLVKTIFIIVLTMIPISLWWSNIDPILQWLGQDQDISSVARSYIAFSIPELIAQSFLHPLRVFLRAQNITKPLTISATFSMILHIPINYILVEYTDLGVKGVALASACNTVNLILGLLVYLFLSTEAVKPWHGQSVSTFFQGWKRLLALMVPSLFSVCLEWWWYEIMVLLCGLLIDPQASVSAMGILIQTTGLIYVLPSSLNMGLSTLVGQALGAEQPAVAQRTTIIGIIVATACGLLALTSAVAVRDVWGKLYTSEPQVLALTSSVLPILGLCELGNCPQTAACGILVGSARPRLGVYINFVAFYLIGLPVATLLAFRLNKGFLGLWYGLAAAQASCVCMMICSLVCTNWKHQVERAKKLTQIPQNQVSLLA
ncbi:hypothetical protein Patl1_06727 [Pistacia atlantica]|uniref:Uncharacterized protein n=1 Tax=Pistacia atlantica TaxID=434234 RepID=A0ACC1BSV2_9ROSI|nr:hypothetical protein Patl1_06727 [Pistacia atlantica]